MDIIEQLCGQYSMCRIVLLCGKYITDRIAHLCCQYSIYRIGQLLGEDTFSKVWLFAKHQWNSVQLVAPEPKNNYKIVKKWFLIMLLCTFCLQRDYKGETGCDGFFHFFKLKTNV